MADAMSRISMSPRALAWRVGFKVGSSSAVGVLLSTSLSWVSVMSWFPTETMTCWAIPAVGSASRQLSRAGFHDSNSSFMMGLV